MVYRVALFATGPEHFAKVLMAISTNTHATAHPLIGAQPGGTGLRAV